MKEKNKSLILINNYTSVYGDRECVHLLISYFVTSFYKILYGKIVFQLCHFISGTFGGRGGRGPVPMGRGGGNQGNKNKKMN